MDVNKIQKLVNEVQTTRNQLQQHQTRKEAAERIVAEENRDIPAIESRLAKLEKELRTVMEKEAKTQ